LRDRSLELVRTGRPARQRFGDQGDALSDLVDVPERTVLLGKRHQLTVSGVRAWRRVGGQHQRQQPGMLAVIGQQLVTIRVSRIASVERSA